MTRRGPIRLVFHPASQSWIWRRPDPYREYTMRFKARDIHRAYHLRLLTRAQSTQLIREVAEATARGHTRKLRAEIIFALPPTRPQ